MRKPPFQDRSFSGESRGEGASGTMQLCERPNRSQLSVHTTQAVQRMVRARLQTYIHATLEFGLVFSLASHFLSRASSWLLSLPKILQKESLWTQAPRFNQVGKVCNGGPIFICTYIFIDGYVLHSAHTAVFFSRKAI